MVRALIFLLTTSCICGAEESEKEFRGWSEGEFVKIVYGYGTARFDANTPFTTEWVKLEKISDKYLKVKRYYSMHSRNMDDFEQTISDLETFKKTISEDKGIVINTEKALIITMAGWAGDKFPPLPSFWDRFR